MAKSSDQSCRPARVTVTQPGFQTFRRAGGVSLALALLAMGGCVSLPPSAERMARLPVVEFPNPPPAGDFILKLPAGKPIPLRVAVQGSLLKQGNEQTLAASIVQDLFVHKEWASWDGKRWLPATDLIGIDLRVALPSDQHPHPGEITLRVDRVAAD